MLDSDQSVKYIIAETLPQAPKGESRVVDVY